MYSVFPHQTSQPNQSKRYFLLNQPNNIFISEATQIADHGLSGGITPAEVRWHYSQHFLAECRGEEIIEDHGLADSTTFLRQGIAPLAQLWPQSRYPGVSLESEMILRPIPKGDKTRFQCVFLDLLDQLAGSLPINSIGIPVSLRHMDIWSGSESIRIAMPIFSVEELQGLLKMNASDWTKALRAAALDNYMEIDPFLRRISGAPLRVRKRAYEKIPVNSCTIIVSYWGDISRVLPGFDHEDLLALDFAVTATRGPQRICVVWSVGSRMFARITTGDQMSWSAPLYSIGSRE